MEEKLIRRKNKALNGGNKHALAEAYNDLATFYYKNNCFKEALNYYQNEKAILKELGLDMEWGTCNRMIGELYMLMAEFDEALYHVNRNLDIAKKLKNLVEEQRAIGEIGRIYLLQGQITTDDIEAKSSLESAKKAFSIALKLCQKLTNQKSENELMDMRARLYLNMGNVHDRLGDLDTALNYINMATTICSSQNLYEILHKCYTAKAVIYKNKKKDNLTALCCLNKALEVAQHLEVKVLKTCETLSSKAEILCRMSDYLGAKRVLTKAWELNTPDVKEKEEIVTNLRIVVEMCFTEELITSTEASEHASLRTLYEKLGDGACRLRNYGGAVDYYLKTLDQAMLAGASGNALVPIYISLYQTCKDLGSYDVALHYYEKEYELIKNVPNEAFNTMINMADTLFLAKKSYDQIEKACLKARQAAQQLKNVKYEIRTLKILLNYQEAYGETDKMVQTKDILRALGCDNLDDLENSEDDLCPTTGCGEGNIIDKILLNLPSDTNEAGTNKSETQRYTVKKNLKGETVLHLAAMAGNKALVERLIAQGHPVDVRDNAGWLPLHEACVRGYLEIIKILIQHGANVNDNGGEHCEGITPLYDAATRGHLEVVELLLDEGARPFQKTNAGNTVIDALKVLRTTTTLTKDQEMLYINIMQKIISLIDSNGRTTPSSDGRTTTTVPPVVGQTPLNNEISSDSDKKRNVNANPNVSSAELIDTAQATSSTKKDGNGMKRQCRKRKSLSKIDLQDLSDAEYLSDDDSDFEFNLSQPYKRLKTNGTAQKRRNNNRLEESAIKNMTSLTSTLPPLVVKVHVKESLLSILIKLDTINGLKIDWLVDEVKNKYYERTGERLLLYLMTLEGIRLSEDDPLGLVLSSPELKTSIIMPTNIPHNVNKGGSKNEGHKKIVRKKTNQDNKRSKYYSEEKLRKAINAVENMELSFFCDNILEKNNKQFTINQQQKDDLVKKSSKQTVNDNINKKQNGSMKEDSRPNLSDTDLYNQPSTSGLQRKNNSRYRFISSTSSESGLEDFEEQRKICYNPFSKDKKNKNLNLIGKKAK